MSHPSFVSRSAIASFLVAFLFSSGAAAAPVSLLPADAAARLADLKPGLFEHLDADGWIFTTPHESATKFAPPR